MAPTANELYQEGKRHFDSKHYVRAEQCFLKLVRMGSHYADVLNMLGIIYHMEEKFNNAIECFQEALKINPRYTEAVLNLAVLYNDLGKYPQAKALYEGLQQNKKVKNEIDPILKGKIANRHAELGDTYRGVGQYGSAIEEYKKALQLCPNFVDIHTKLGIAYRENNQKELSVKELSQTVKSAPEYLPARIQLGLSYYTQKAVPKALKEWDEVLKRDPKNSAAQMYLGLCQPNGKK